MGRARICIANCSHPARQYPRGSRVICCYVLQEYQYEAQGHLSHTIDGNILSQKAVDADGAREIANHYTYDSFGRLKLAISGGMCYTYEYTPEGRLKRKSSTYTYHTDGQKPSLTDVTGKTVFYRYDSLRRLKALVNKQGQELVRYVSFYGGYVLKKNNNYFKFLIWPITAIVLTLLCIFLQPKCTLIVKDGVLIGVRDGVFENKKELTNIIVPDNVTKIGIFAFKECNALESIQLSTNLISIETGAFSGCSNLKAIKIPEGVIEIQAVAFQDCSSLPSVEIPASVEFIGSSAFSGCSKLKEMNLPESIVQIEDGTFDNCSSLRKVVLPDGLLSIGMAAFRNCTSLREMRFFDGLIYINQSAFENCQQLNDLVIPDSIVSIGDDAFNNCISLQNMYLPDSIDDIGRDSFHQTPWLSLLEQDEYGCKYIGSILIECSTEARDVVVKSDIRKIAPKAFNECIDLMSIELPEGIEDIGESAFAYCSKLSTIELPDSLVNLGDCVFANCTSLEYIKVPEGIKRIGVAAFSGCNKLQMVELPDRIISIGKSAFAETLCLNRAGEEEKGYIYMEQILVTTPKEEAVVTVKEGTGIIADGTSSFTFVETLELPNSLTIIGEDAFWGCYNLKEIRFGNNLRYIESSGFMQCASLEKLMFPASIERIGRGAFYSCSNLKEISFGENLKEIEDMAFWGCSKLEIINISEGLEVIGKSAFSACHNLRAIEVPESVISIGDGAFDNCKRLKTMKLPEHLRDSFSYTGKAKIIYY